jgi:hypothetical protein
MPPVEVAVVMKESLRPGATVIRHRSSRSSTPDRLQLTGCWLLLLAEVAANSKAVGVASLRRVQGCAGRLTQCVTWPILVAWVAFRPEPPLPCGEEQLPSHQTERKA